MKKAIAFFLMGFFSSAFGIEKSAFFSAEESWNNPKEPSVVGFDELIYFGGVSDDPLKFTVSGDQTGLGKKIYTYRKDSGSTFRGKRFLTCAMSAAEKTHGIFKPEEMGKRFYTGGTSKRSLSGYVEAGSSSSLSGDTLKAETEYEILDIWKDGAGQFWEKILTRDNHVFWITSPASGEYGMKNWEVFMASLHNQMLQDQDPSAAGTQLLYTGVCFDQEYEGVNDSFWSSRG